MNRPNPTGHALRGTSLRLLACVSLLVAASSFLLPGDASADGGRLVFRSQAGPFTVTLFSTPETLRVGSADLSVALEKQGVDGLDMTPQVTLQLQPEDGHGAPITVPLSHAAATSRFLQAAAVELPHTGAWRVTASVQDSTSHGSCTGELQVLPASLLLNDMAWQIAAVPLIVLGFLLHQWRKSAVKRRFSKPAQPSAL